MTSRSSLSPATRRGASFPGNHGDLSQLTCPHWYLSHNRRVKHVYLSVNGEVRPGLYMTNKALRELPGHRAIRPMDFSAIIFQISEFISGSNDIEC